MILITPRLELRPILGPATHRDHNLFVKWLNDPEVVKYSEQRHKVHTAETQTDYWYSSATVDPNSIHSIYLRDGEKPIGSISAAIDQNNDIANVGIMVGDRAAQGHGYGFEAWECVCNYLFIERGIRKIEAGCMVVNTPMNRICVKYGMRLEAVVLDHFLLDGKPVAMHLYGSIGER